MEPTKRIIVNTLAQHLRSLVNICLSLYSSRLILQALGLNDFGIYSLIAGVVAMLGFLTHAMVVTTQRQLSFYLGHGTITEVRRMFANSIFLHLLLGILFSLILFIIEPLLFDNILIIETTRIPAATVVYYLVILSLFIAFLTAPYRALFISRENIIYISIVDILDGVIKLGAAIWLLHYSSDRLIAYAWVITGITLFNMLALVIWSQLHFEESLIIPRIKELRYQSLKELVGFAGWTIYSLGCIIGRTQGTAVIFNHFFGTLINTAYGISQQLYGSIQFIAQSVLNAMSPQLIKAEGASDRQRMLHLAEQLSKYAFLLLAIVVIPVVWEMPDILQTWLIEVPDYATTICRFILLTALCDQLTIGLGTANQAIGAIRNYSLAINTIKVLTLPAIWLFLYYGYSVTIAMFCYMIFEIICAMLRLPFLKMTAGLSIRSFFSHVFVKITFPLISLIISGFLCVSFLDFPLRFLVTALFCIGTTIPVIWITALDSSERAFVTQNIFKKRK